MFPAERAQNLVVAVVVVVVRVVEAVAP